MAFGTDPLSLRLADTVTQKPWGQKGGSLGLDQNRGGVKDSLTMALAAPKTLSARSDSMWVSVPATTRLSRATEASGPVYRDPPDMTDA